MENRMPLPNERSRYDEVIINETEKYVASNLTSASEMLVRRYEYDEADLYDAQFTESSFSSMHDRPMRDGRVFSYGFSVTPVVEEECRALSLAYQLSHIESSKPVDLSELPRELRVMFRETLWAQVNDGGEVDFTEEFVDMLGDEVIDGEYADLQCIMVTSYSYDCRESDLSIIKTVRTSYMIDEREVFSCEGGGIIDDPEVGEQYQQMYMDMGVDNEDAIELLLFGDEIGAINHEDIERMNEVLHWNGLDAA